MDERRPMSLARYNCLTALSAIPSSLYEFLVRTPIFRTPRPNNEARYLMMDNQGYPHQEWQLNSTTSQLASVQYPKLCMTTKHFNDPTEILLLECNGYGFESPNPQLNQHQRFYFKPALDKNREQLCHV